MSAPRESDSSPDDRRVSAGVPGLDDILHGGWAAGRLFLIEGRPGTGKTTFGMQCLLATAATGASGLYLTLSETVEELRSTAAAHGWLLPSSLAIAEMVSAESLLEADQQQSLLHASDLELGETTQRILDTVRAAKPSVVVIDSLSELRLLAQGPARYRRQVLALKQFFAQLRITVLALDDMTGGPDDLTVHSVAHGVLRLEELAPLYGAERRRLRVLKYRGSRYRGGFHDFLLDRGGAKVFPRLRAVEHKGPAGPDAVSSGIEGLDTLLGGGIARGSSILLLGPAGTGKSLLTLRFVQHALERGERAAAFIFDEELELLRRRSKGVGLDLDQASAGTLHLEQVDAAEIAPGEFAHRVRHCVDELGAQTVVIDSLNGYQAAMPEEQFLQLHIHELLLYLNRQGVTTFLTVAQHGLVGDMRTPVDVTYLADTVLLLRYFESAGRIRRAMSVVKNRSGAHEDTIREYQITSQGLRVGDALTEFHGVLQGVPTFTGTTGALLTPEQPPFGAPDE